MNRLILYLYEMVSSGVWWENNKQEDSW